MKELKLISSNAIIGELYQDFNIEGSAWTHKAKRWIARGIEVMELSGYYERATLWDDVVEYSAPLPCDLRVLCVVLAEGIIDEANCDTGLPTATTPAANSTDAYGNTIQAIYESKTLYRLPLSNSLVLGQPFQTISPCVSAKGYVNNSRLHTNFEEGRILYVYYRPPLDNEGFPMVPDFGLSIEALNYWIIYKMSLGGYKHPVIDFGTAWQMWNELYPQAKNRINYPSLEEMQSFTEMMNNPIIGDWANKLYLQP